MKVGNMCLCVLNHFQFIAECFVTHGTHVFLFVCQTQVFLQMTASCECFITYTAHKWFLASVNSVVNPQISHP